MMYTCFFRPILSMSSPLTDDIPACIGTLSRFSFLTGRVFACAMRRTRWIAANPGHVQVIVADGRRIFVRRSLVFKNSPHVLCIRSPPRLRMKWFFSRTRRILLPSASGSRFTCCGRPRRPCIKVFVYVVDRRAELRNSPRKLCCICAPWSSVFVGVFVRRYLFI